MLDPQLRLSLAITVFTVASGLFDSLGLTNASRMWQEGKLVWSATALSGLCFLLGMAMYWGAVRYLGEAGIGNPELQALLWFGVTIVGVAVMGGQFFQWQLLDQVVAMNVLASLAWLLSRGAATAS